MLRIKDWFLNLPIALIIDFDDIRSNTNLQSNNLLLLLLLILVNVFMED